MTLAMLQLQLHVVLDQPKGWIDYVMAALGALGALGTVVAAAAALKAVNVTRSIAGKQSKLQETLANKQFDLQKAQQELLERQLRKDLYDRRFTVFTDTGQFMRPVLSSPNGFTPEADEYRRFGETVQNAEMLFGPEVCKYLEDVDRTAVGRWASNQRRTTDRGDINAITEYAEQFQHLSDLWQKRTDVFRREISLG